MADFESSPEVTVHVRTAYGTVGVCICRSCRSFRDDAELRGIYGDFTPWYRAFKRQRRMRRKKRRGWA